jgi:hypothetical protein
MKMEQTGCSETLAYKIQTPGNHPEESILHLLLQCHHMSLMDFVVSPPGCGLSEVGTPMRRSYVVPMRWIVIYEYEVPGGALNDI